MIFPSDRSFQFATVCNGLAAIAAGQIGSWVRDSFDSLVAPFDAAIAFLAVAAVIISVSWGENSGGSSSQSTGMESKLKTALTLLRNDPRFIVLGLVQSFFEAAMYIVVFMWTPRLEPYFSYLPHGQVFGCFMACTMIGSCCVGALTKLAQPESYLRCFNTSLQSWAIPSANRPKPLNNPMPRLFPSLFPFSLMSSDSKMCMLRPSGGLIWSAEGCDKV